MDDPTEEFRLFGEITEPEPTEPEPDELRNNNKEPRTPLHESNTFRAMTFGVLVFAILWAAATILAPDIKPSKLTFLGFLACLIFYSGEYISWKRPKLPKPKHERKRGYEWRTRD